MIDDRFEVMEREARAFIDAHPDPVCSKIMAQFALHILDLKNLSVACFYCQGNGFLMIAGQAVCGCSRCGGTGRTEAADNG